MKRLMFVGVVVAVLLTATTVASAACVTYDTMAADMLLGWGAWNGSDRDWDGIIDEYSGALACIAMCQNPTIGAVYDANLAYAHSVVDGPNDLWFTTYAWELDDASASQMAAYALWDEWANMILWFWWYPGSMSNWQLVPELTANGDYDGDGLTNLQEYNYIIGIGGTPQDYAMAASSYIQQNGTDLPVAGFAGLAALAAACAAGGAWIIRRKK